MVKIEKTVNRNLALHWNWPGHTVTIWKTMIRVRIEDSEAIQSSRYRHDVPAHRKTAPGPAANESLAVAGFGRLGHLT
eukprot:3094045-Rhodomonas_salina.2